MDWRPSEELTDDEKPKLYECPWCGHKQTIDQIRECSGYKPSGMPPNETGHYYGCGCQDCRIEYQMYK